MSTSRPLLRVALAHLVYNLLLHLTCLLAVLPLLLRLPRDRAGWRWTLARLGRLPPGRPPGPTIWIHAVSVGEVKASRSLVAALRAHAGEATVVISTGTLSGRDTARSLFPDLYVFAWPLDLPLVVDSVLRRLKPRLVLLVEWEVWPGFSRLADRHAIPQVIVNGRVSESSFRTYRRWRWWLPEFDRLTLVAAQTDGYAQRMAELGVPAERISVTGNLKHDLTEPAPVEQVAELSAQLGLGTCLPVLVAGSTHEGEEAALVEAWVAAGGAARSQLVIVPRHLQRLQDIGRLLDRRAIPWVLRSVCAPDRDPSTVLLVDTMGELEGLFGLADLVFLGGSLVPVGGHNLLEPAAAGCPLLTGPWLESCREQALILEQAGALTIVQDAEQLSSAIRAMLRDEAQRKRAGNSARAVTLQLAGATQRTLTLLQSRGLLNGTFLDPAAQYATLAASDSSRTN